MRYRVSRRFLATMGLVALALFIQPLWGESYSISPGDSLKAIVNTLQPGDVVNVMPGTYNEVMRISASGTAENPITIRGIGSAVFDGTGQNVSGYLPNPRAIMELVGSHIVLENLTFQNASNGHNGSGVRIMESASHATIRDCAITACEMGMMGGASEYTLVEGCDIGWNGCMDTFGYSHNMYMAGPGTVEVRGSYIHDAFSGQNFKSRAHYNELWYNWISDSEGGEVGPVDSDDTIPANSNFVMVGNTVVSKANRSGNTLKYVLFGEDLGGAHNGTMYMYNNTLIAGSYKIDFIVLFDRTGNADAVAANNVFYGSDDLVEYWSSSYHPPIPGEKNWIETTDDEPAEWSDSVVGTTPGFMNIAGRDYRLLATSDCIDEGAEGLTYVDGDGVTHTLAVEYCYIPGRGLVPRGTNGPLDIGAYEFITPGDADRDGDIDAVDLAQIGLNWSPGGSGLYWEDGDFDDDGDVDAGDLADVGLYWNPTGAIPEPTCVGVLALGGLALLRRKRA